MIQGEKSKVKDELLKATEANSLLRSQVYCLQERLKVVEGSVASSTLEDELRMEKERVCTLKSKLDASEISRASCEQTRDKLLSSEAELKSRLNVLEEELRTEKEHVCALEIELESADKSTAAGSLICPEGPIISKDGEPLLPCLGGNGSSEDHSANYATQEVPERENDELNEGELEWVSASVLNNMTLCSQPVYKDRRMTFTSNAPFVTVNDPPQATRPTMNPTNPTTFPTRPTVDPTSSTMDHTRPTVDYTRPTVDPTSSTMDYTRPTVDHTRPTVDTSRPTVDYTRPTVDPTSSTMDYTRPTVDYTRPTVDTSRPTVDHTRPTADPTRLTMDPLQIKTRIVGGTKHSPIVGDPNRVYELKRRNTVVPPHLRSSYPIETQVQPETPTKTEDMIRSGRGPVMTPPTTKGSQQQPQDVLGTRMLVDQEQENSRRMSVVFDVSVAGETKQLPVHLKRRMDQLQAEKSARRMELAKKQMEKMNEQKTQKGKRKPLSVRGQ